MASATSLPLKSIFFTTALVVGLSTTRAGLRDLVLRICTGPGKYSRIFVLVVILTNIKNVPFVWHYRVWSAILRHCLFTKPNIPAEIAPSTVFLPVICSSRSPLYECDYNFHKSNSTYFSDLDISRSHLVCALLQPGIERLQHNKREKLVLDKEGNAVTGRWMIGLGSVMCSFKREIGILESYEMWSRILCWDRKWIYVVTHFVKKGTVKPSAYLLEDNSWFSKRGLKHVKGDGKVHTKETDEKNIFASAISKYVVKLGRLTVHPEVFFQASDILPPKPGGWATMSGPSGESTPAVEIEIGSTPVGTTTNEWDWERIEAENKRGLKLAEHLAALDHLHHEFTGSETPALGKYTTGLLW